MSASVLPIFAIAGLLRVRAVHLEFEVLDRNLLRAALIGAAPVIDVKAKERD